MKSFNEFITEVRSVQAIRPPFFIAIKNGMRFAVMDEITSHDDDVQNQIFSKYMDEEAWIIPAKENSQIRVGDIISKRDLRRMNALSLEYFAEENEELSEAMAKKKIRILKGKRVVQYRCPPGHHKKKRGGRSCVRTTGKRKYKVSRGAKKAARKRRARKTTINRKRGRSMRKRRGMGL